MQSKHFLLLALAALGQAQEVEQTAGPAVQAVETYISGVKETLSSLEQVLPTSVFQELVNPTLGPELGGAAGVEKQPWFAELPGSVQTVVASIADQESSIYVANGGEATATGQHETGTASVSEVSGPTSSASVKTESATSAPPTTMSMSTKSGTSTSSSAKSSGTSKTKKGSAAKPTGAVAGAVMGLGGVLAGAALLM